MREVIAWIAFAWFITFCLFLPEQTGADVGTKAALFMKGWHSAQPPVTVPRVACKES